MPMIDVYAVAGRSPTASVQPLQTAPSATSIRAVPVPTNTANPEEVFVPLALDRLPEGGRPIELCGVGEHAEVVEADERQRGDRWPAEPRLTSTVGQAHVGRVIGLERHGSHRQR